MKGMYLLRYLQALGGFEFPKELLKIHGTGACIRCRQRVGRVQEQAQRTGVDARCRQRGKGAQAGTRVQKRRPGEFGNKNGIQRGEGREQNGSGVAEQQRKSHEPQNLRNSGGEIQVWLGGLAGGKKSEART